MRGKPAVGVSLLNLPRKRKQGSGVAFEVGSKVLRKSPSRVLIQK